MRKRVFCIFFCLLTIMVFLPAIAFADDGNTGTNIYVDATNGNDEIENVGTSADKAYKTLETAVNAAKSGDTIQLAAGTYTLYQKGANILEKDLTFVGAGTGQTTWLIGPKVPDPAKFGTEYNSDYSFDVRNTTTKETVTFKNMTLQSGSVNYLGFAGTDNTIVEDCVIDGMTFYWGNTSAIFKNTVFNCPPGDYAIWTYGTAEETFDGCTFNSTGKIINVYADYNTTANDVTINFKDCTVNDSVGNKPVLNINDSNKGDKKYYINISGDNVVSGVKADRISCSRLFGFSGRDTNNTGRSVVTMEGTTVWENGKRAVPHAHDLTSGSYNDGLAAGTENQYTDGYKDDAFTKTMGEWTAAEYGVEYRLGTRVCDYCGYTEDIAEVRLSANKTVSSKAPTGSEYDFVLKDKEGNTLQSKQNVDGSVNFDEVLLTEAGTYQYTISEVAGTNEKIIYDDAVYTATIVFTGGTDASVTVSYTKGGEAYTDTPLFANMIKSSSGTPTTPEDPTTPDDPTTPADDEEPADDENPGDTEEPGDDEDQDEDPGDGADPSDNGKSDNTKTTKKSTAPNTGDDSLIELWVLLIAACGATLFGIRSRERK